MNLTEYYALAKRTAGEVSSLNKDDAGLVYFSLGLMEECCEYFSLADSNRDVEIKKELGDCFWYLAMLLPVVGIEAKEIEGLALARKWPLHITNNSAKLVSITGDLIGRVKKVVFHKHERDDTTFKYLLAAIYDYLLYAIHLHGFTLDDVLSTNVEKLRKRYPDGFSTENSITRKDEK